MTSETPSDEIVERYEGTFDRHTADARLARAAAGQRYWTSIRNRAQELFDPRVEPGRDYALTEVVRCASVTERAGDVLTAARFCGPEYLPKTLALSGARVVVGVGEHAMRTLPKVLAVTAHGGVQEVKVGDRNALVTFLPGPGSSKPKTFHRTHTDEERERLRAALA